MQKIILVDPTKCTGCRTCELVCSVKHTGAANPSRGRITIVKWEMECFEIPMLCQQCEQAPCAEVCPVKAITRDEVLGVNVIDHDKCIVCKMCVLACPFGAMKYDVRGHKVAKCDQCHGEPTCVSICDTHAVSYVDANVVNNKKQRDAASRGYTLRKEQKEAIGPDVGHP
ncbi:MAG: 4Fe-4S dicluster domain-containing protein [Chloroflexi bacterium]|nr:4Fe-4S dicluster domain-containing protein [Chloroflexota bacterium]